MTKSTIIDLLKLIDANIFQILFDCYIEKQSLKKILF